MLLRMRSINAHSSHKLCAVYLNSIQRDNTTITAATTKSSSSPGFYFHLYFVILYKQNELFLNI